MAKGQRRHRLTACFLLATTAPLGDAQTTGDSAPTQSEPASEAQPTPVDNALNLWGIANSLLSVYYPSATISDLGSLSWPSEVVIGSSTYTQTPATSDPSATETSASDSTPSTSIPTTSSASPSITVRTSSPLSSPPSSTLATVPISSHDVSRPVTTNESTTSDAEPSESSEESSGYPRDRTLGIALGVVFGVLAVAVLLFAICFVDRRQKKHGGTGLLPSRKRRGNPTDSEIYEWRNRHPHIGLATAAVGPMSRPQEHQEDPPRPSRDWVDRYNRLADQHTPPAHLHPAFMHQHQHTESAGTLNSETNPFFSPTDRSRMEPDNASEHSEYHPGYPKLETGFAHIPTSYTPYRPAPKRSSMESSHRRSSSSERHERNSRPPTPFSPMMMMQTSSPPQRAPQMYANNNNPFASDDDYGYAEEADIAERERLTYYDANEDNDVVSPIQPPPSKSPARRSTPLVHYPSWSEVNDFDFGAQSGARGQRNGNFGADEYRRDRERVDGRTELA